MNEHALTSDSVFTYKTGLNFAVAFTAYDGETEWILDPSYGELVFKLNSWGVNPDGTFFIKREKMNEHICSRDELGLTDNKEAAKFMPISDLYKPFIDTYQKKFICMDTEDLFLYGDYDSTTASLLNMQLIKCTGRDDCKSEEEILEFFRTKFIILLYNEIRFNTDEFG